VARSGIPLQRTRSISRIEQKSQFDELTIDIRFDETNPYCTKYEDRRNSRIECNIDCSIKRTNPTNEETAET
jgi:hypothetical protein